MSDKSTAETGTQGPIRAVLRGTLDVGERQCALCGGLEELGPVNAALVEPDQGFVCWKCISFGPEKARARILNRARRREAAERGIVLPSWAEYEAASQVAAECLRGVCPECGKPGEVLAIEDEPVFYCREHRVKWLPVRPGLNWPPIDPEQRERWRRLYEKLDFGSYREVEGDYFDPERHAFDIPAALARRRGVARLLSDEEFGRTPADPGSNGLGSGGGGHV